MCEDRLKTNGKQKLHQQADKNRQHVETNQRNTRETLSPVQLKLPHKQRVTFRHERFSLSDLTEFYSYPTALSYGGPSYFLAWLCKLAAVSLVPLVELASRTRRNETALISGVCLFFQFKTLTPVRDLCMLEWLLWAWRKAADSLIVLLGWSCWLSGV